MDRWKSHIFAWRGAGPFTLEDVQALLMLDQEATRLSALLALGFGTWEVGLLSTATLLGSALATVAVGTWGHKFARPNGNTPLGNALSAATRTVMNSPLSRKHVLIITDGENTAGPEPAASRRRRAVGRRRFGIVRSPVAGATGGCGGSPGA